MNIDESKIQELINNEVKQQVTNKMKQVGRETIKNLYKEAMAEELRSFILKQEVNLVKELKKEINYDKDVWKNTVATKLTDGLMAKIESSCYEDQWD